MRPSPSASQHRGLCPDLTDEERRSHGGSRRRCAVPRKGLTRLARRRYPPFDAARRIRPRRPWKRSLSWRFDRGADFHSPLIFRTVGALGTASRSQTSNRREYR